MPERGLGASHSGVGRWLKRIIANSLIKTRIGKCQPFGESSHASCRPRLPILGLRTRAGSHADPLSQLAKTPLPLVRFSSQVPNNVHHAYPAPNQ
jgi:hypothetical protein